MNESSGTGNFGIKITHPDGRAITVYYPTKETREYWYNVYRGKPKRLVKKVKKVDRKNK